MEMDFYEVVRQRRTNYHIGDDEIIPFWKVEDLVKMAIQHSPSAFNMQTGRAVVLYKEHHKKLWDIVWDSLKDKVSGDQKEKTKAKLDGFSKGLGTVLFYNDQDTIKGMKHKFSTYADSIPSFVDQSIGMMQYIVWCSLDNEGLGVSLQHYNPLIDRKVEEEWNIPSSWELVSQMVFGSWEDEPDNKEVIDPDDKMVIFR